MALSPFEDKSHHPEPDELSTVLGPSAELWNQLISDVARNHAPIEEVWNFSGVKYGWSVRLKRKDRIVLYLIPQVGHFLVGIVLGEKAVKAAHLCGLPGPVIDLIDHTRPYGEGLGIRLPVTTPEDLVVIQKLAAAKMAQ